jgi:hypothetical protein
MRNNLKKGSLSLSINAIVVLIMAITMLGLGLAFMKNSMGSTMKQFSNVNEDIKAEMIKELQESSGRLTFKGEDVKFKQGEKREMYFALKNDLTSAANYSIDVGCDKSMVGVGVATTINLNTFKAVTIQPGKIEVGKIAIAVTATQVPDTYSCHINTNFNQTGAAIMGSSGEKYENKQFYLTVE